MSILEVEDINACLDTSFLQSEKRNDIILWHSSFDELELNSGITITSQSSNFPSSTKHEIWDFSSSIVTTNDIEVNNHSNIVRQKLLKFVRSISFCFSSAISSTLPTKHDFSSHENNILNADKNNGNINNQQFVGNSTNQNFVINSSRRVRRRSSQHRSKLSPNIDNIPSVSVPKSLPSVTVPPNNRKIKTTAKIDVLTQNKLYCFINQREGSSVGFKNDSSIVTFDELFLTELTLQTEMTNSTALEVTVPELEVVADDSGPPQIEQTWDDTKHVQVVQEKLEELINQRNPTECKNSVAKVISTGELFSSNTPPAESSKAFEEIATDAPTNEHGEHVLSAVDKLEEKQVEKETTEERVYMPAKQSLEAKVGRTLAKRQGPMGPQVSKIVATVFDRKRYI